MLGSSITILALVLFAGTLSFTELPVARGGLLSTGIMEFRIFKVLVPLLATALLFFLVWKPLPAHHFLVSIVADKTAQDVVEIALAAVLSSALGMQISRFTSPVLAMAGAFVGASLIDGISGSATFLWIILPWIAAPFLAILFSSIIYKVTDKYIHARKLHLLRMDRIMENLLIAASLLFLLATIFNISPLFAIFSRNLPFESFIPAAVIVLVPLLIHIIFVNRIGYDSWKFSEKYMDVSTSALFAVILSTGLVLAICPVPISCTYIVLASIAGVSFSGETAILEKEELGYSLLSALATFVIAFVLGYGFSLSNDPKSAMVILLLVLVLTGSLALLRFRRERALQKSIILSREQQIDAGRRTLSALEIKAEMTEKDLSNKLDLKRKELVDFAIGVSEQKQYTEELYSRLQDLRSVRDAEEKNRMLDDIIKDLRERMHSSNEANDIYAQSEILHKDFNMKLRELFPNLTENERKLANLLRQGFTCKQIASIMNITTKSAEINRYRLRIKLGLKRSDNLINYIKSI